MIQLFFFDAEMAIDLMADAYYPDCFISIVFNKRRLIIPIKHLLLIQEDSLYQSNTCFSIQEDSLYRPNTYFQVSGS